MFVYRLHASLLVVALADTISFVSAQNSSIDSRCPLNIGSFNPDAPVNSTGKVKFQFNNSDTDFYFSTTYNDSRIESTEFVKYSPEVTHEVQGWLSAPNNTSGYFCVYKLHGMNASSPEGGMNGCEGVLSTECIDELVKTTLPVGSDTSSRCPRVETTDGLKKFCGNTSVIISTCKYTDIRIPYKSTVFDGKQILIPPLSSANRSVQLHLRCIFTTRGIDT
jgi:hypothetical protein